MPSGTYAGPLEQVNATWNYKAGESKFTLKATEHKKIGTRWCAHVVTLQDNKEVGSEDVSVQDDGVYRVKVRDEEIKPPFLIIKTPLTKGGEWAVGSATKSFASKGKLGSFTFSIHVLDSNSGAVHPQVSRIARHQTPFRLIPVVVGVRRVHHG